MSVFSKFKEALFSPSSNKYTDEQNFVSSGRNWLRDLNLLQRSDFDEFLLLCLATNKHNMNCTLDIHYEKSLINVNIYMNKFWLYVLPKSKIKRDIYDLAIKGGLTRHFKHIVVQFDEFKEKDLNQFEPQ